jgi:hypothetical protein
VGQADLMATAGGVARCEPIENQPQSARARIARESHVSLKKLANQQVSVA